jgi:orotidine-5'-phosphate decarboxylase
MIEGRLAACRMQAAHSSDASIAHSLCGCNKSLSSRTRELNCFPLVQESMSSTSCNVRFELDNSCRVGEKVCAAGSSAGRTGLTAAGVRAGTAGEVARLCSCGTLELSIAVSARRRRSSASRRREFGCVGCTTLLLPSPPGEDKREAPA